MAKLPTPNMVMKVESLEPRIHRMSPPFLGVELVQVGPEAGYGSWPTLPFPNMGDPLKGPVS